jgi:glycosyltransferase involved in cell wall biosynthesis
LAQRTGRVSVVMPCRNAAPWIAEALDSLAAQSTPPHEVVVVDDGSTDGSGEAVQTWSRAHPEVPVTLLRQEGLGLRVALATAVQASAGEMICRLDADDRLAPDFLELLTAALDGAPGLAYAYPVMQMFGDATGPYYTREFSGASLVFQGNFVCAGALVRRTAYLEVGGLSDLPAWEDWDLWLRLLARGHEGVLVQDASYGWRRHGETRNQLTWLQRRVLRLRIWWRHRRLLLRFAPQALPMIVHRLRNPVRQQ